MGIKSIRITYEDGTFACKEWDTGAVKVKITATITSTIHENWE